MIETERLILRRWRDGDRPAWHAMGQDPEVMAFLGPPLSPEAADAAMARQNALMDSHGHCFWAVECKEDGAFLGFCGLKPGPEGTPLHGEIEIGWRVARPIGARAMPARPRRRAWTGPGAISTCPASPR
jgi:RimJ/RimL family protein N-acetyltransferase